MFRGEEYDLDSGYEKTGRSATAKRPSDSARCHQMIRPVQYRYRLSQPSKPMNDAKSSRRRRAFAAIERAFENFL